MQLTNDQTPGKFSSELFMQNINLIYGINDQKQHKKPVQSVAE